MNKERITYLCHRYLDNSATAEELLELETILNDPNLDAALKAVIDSTYYDIINNELTEHINAEAREKSFQYIVAQRQNKKQLTLWPRIAAAACLLIGLSIASYFLLHKESNQQFANNNYKNDIAPDSTVAILKSGHGKTFVLTGLHNGKLYQQGNTAATKTAEGQVEYAATPQNQATPVTYDTIQLAKGGPYHLKLADGSKVTLNAGTTLRYPTSFNGSKRELELITGEAFFDVVHNEHAPLGVKTPRATIQDIGTKFNVSAYPDEPDSRTTLTEGSVKITHGTTTKILIPGQQAIANSNGLTVAAADIDAETAWLDNDFVFHNQELSTIMRELARWYHIEVTYKDDVSNLRFSCMVSRNHKISAVLASMENTGKIYFRIDGKKVTVFKGKKK